MLMAREPTKTSDRHEQMRLDVIEAMRPYDDIPAVEQLALICVFVGQLIALQDSTRYSPEKIMAMVAANVELGNAQLLTAVGLGIVKP
jgi:hypothetical protein